MFQFEMTRGWVLTLIRALLFVGGVSRQTVAFSQSDELPIQSLGTVLLERLATTYPGKSPIHTDVRGYWRRDAAALAAALDSSRIAMRPIDRRSIHFLLLDSHEWVEPKKADTFFQRPFLRFLYRTPAHFFEVNQADFKLRINPMLHVAGGRDLRVSHPVLLNQRGLEIRGIVDRKVFFYTNLIESQASYPAYLEAYISRFKAIPGAGFYKPFNRKPYVKGYDFNIATAYVGFQATRHIQLQLGHGQHFIGNGYRSMLLSDLSNPAFYLKISTRIWRIHYQNLFMELSPVSQVSVPDGTLLPKKYAAIHYLSCRISPRFSVGLFEAAVFHRSRQFEFQYLNPVIFYRTVEGMIGSPDNVLLGFNTRYQPAPRVQLYSQMVFDEIRLSELFSGSGWWGNKFAFQAGCQYFQAMGVDGLDLRAEFNLARPYTYAHQDPADSYTHYNQALAHPSGANFEEWIGIIRYRPVFRWFIEGRVLHIRQGDDRAAENWGANPLLSYDTRQREYNNRVGQGIVGRTALAGLTASWMWGHQLFLDFKWLSRIKNSADAELDLSSHWWSIGLRMNFWPAPSDF